jgi:NAD(P)-dependent dehydrogenase (short-subunit alcohol dehydrogenase family)
MKKSILITGSTDGIGKLAALKMARDGHQLYLHGRNSDKLNNVINEIKSASGNQSVSGFTADFSELNEVEKMSDEINEKISSLDVLINNAGVFKSSNALTDKGIDIRIAVNYFAPYLLTNRIIEKLKASSDARIINLSSAAQSPVSLDLLSGNIEVSEQEAYAQSKLAILMWSFYLADQEKDIVTVALNPGSLLNTKMVKEAYGKFWSSADKGADIIYDLALIKKSEDINGQYFDNDKGGFGMAHPDAYNSEIVDKLIEKTIATLKSL